MALALRGAQLRPLVLVYEDLHWIDPTTEAFLGTLQDVVASVPLMLLLTYRIGYTPPFGSRSFLRAAPVLEAYEAVGRHPPPDTT